MMSLSKKMILVFALCLAFIAKPISSYAESSDHINNLQFTHTLATAFFNSYFNEGDEKYRIKYLAHKQYILTFLNTWGEMIDSGEYKSSEEIFNAIKNTPGYLSKYYFIWENLPKANPINLGEMKNGALQSVIASEKESNLEKRIIEVLHTTNMLVLANSFDYLLATAIATPFKNVENAEIRRLAKIIIEGVPFQNGVQIAVLVKDLLVPGSAILGAPSKVEKLAKVYKATSRLRTTLALLKSRSIHAAAKIANPYLKRMNPIQITMAGSAALHAGVIFWGYNSSASNEIPKNNFDSISFALASFWESAQEMHDSTDAYVLNFKSNFKFLNKEQLSNKILSVFNRQAKPNYAEIFLAMEKYQSIDKRAATDLLAADFMQGKLADLKNTIFHKYTSKVGKNELNEIRKTVIEGYLKKYKRDYPNLTSTLIGWGGNCVAQTMLFIAILQELEPKFTDGHALGVVTYTDHIEAVVYNQNEIFFTVSGKVAPRPGAKIFKPEALLLMALNNLGVDSKLTTENFIASGSPSNRKTIVNSKTFNPSGIFSTIFRQTKREGIFENQFQNIDTTWKGPNQAAAIGDIPEEATMSYSDFSQYSDNGLSSIISADDIREEEKTAKQIKIIFKADPSSILHMEYSEMSDTIYAYKESAYHKLMRAKQRGGSAKDFLKNFYFQQIRATQELFNNADFKKLILDPAQAWSYNTNPLPEENYLQIMNKFSTEEIARAKMYRKLLMRIYIRSNQYCQGTKTEPYCNKYAVDAKAVGVESSEFRQQWNMVFNVEKKMLAAFDENPELFFKIYKELSLESRALQNEIMSNPLILFRSKDTLLAQQLPLRIRNYLNKLPAKSTNVELSDIPSHCIENKRNIQLPVAQDRNNGLFHFEELDKDCKIKPTTAKNSNPHLVPQEMISLKPEVLVELSITYGAGFQLWNKKMVDAFINNTYGNTIYGRKLDLEYMEPVIAVPQLRETKEVGYLREYLIN